MMYACKFDFEGSVHFAASEKLQHFIFGFWVTQDLELTNREDSHYWIPPSKILYVEKVEEDSDN